MKWFSVLLKTVGALVVGLVAAMLAFHFAMGRELDASSKEATEQIVRDVTKEWSLQAAEEKADPVLKEILAKDRASTEKFLGLCSQRLGALQSIESNKGDAQIFFNLAGPKVNISSHYKLQVKFSRASAELEVRMVRIQEVWLLREFRVYSDLLRVP